MLLVNEPKTYDTKYNEAKEAISLAEEEHGTLNIARIQENEIYFDGRRLGRNYVARIREDGKLFVDEETSHGKFIMDQLTPEEK